MPPSAPPLELSKHSWRAAQWAPDFTAAVVVAAIQITVKISYAALIFSGNLAPYVGIGIGLALLSAFVLCLITALSSSFPVTLAAPQDAPVVIFGLLAASLATDMLNDSAALLPTVLAALFLTTTLTGIFFFALGQFRLGRLVRYVPYPVIGGFLAGTGWLLVQGSFTVLVGTEMSSQGTFLLMQPDMLVRWLPALVGGVGTVILLRHWKNVFAMPLVVLVSMAIFYLGLFLSGHSLAQAQAQNWMIGPFPSTNLVEFVTPFALTNADWNVVLGQADKIAAILAVSVISLLLNASAIELAVQRDMDFNRELKAVGLGNFIAGLFAGMPGYHLLSSTVLAYKLGARSRMTGIFTALMFGAVLVFGASLLAYLPRLVLGGLLVFLGVSLLVEWLYDAWFKLPHLDYALIVIIVAVIAVFGFLPGVAIGIGIATILFVIKYSSIQVVKHALTGATFRSSVERSPTEHANLRAHGKEVLIFQLQEFIFFGTAQKLLDQIRARIQEPTRVPLQYIVLDFRRVPGLDSSAVASFLRLQQLTHSQHIELVLTQVKPAIQLQLTRGGIGTRAPHTQFFPALDYGVEWCEDQILTRKAIPRDPRADSLDAQLAQILRQPTDAARLRAYLERVELPAGTQFIQQGAAADALYFIEQGQVSVELQLADGKTVRLRTIEHGTVVGEVAMYLEGARTASVVALTQTVLYRFSAEAIQTMEANDPDLAAALHRWIVRVIAERLSDNVRTLEAMMD